VRRALVLWLLLFGAYAATLGLHPAGETHQLAAVESLDGGTLDKSYELGFPALLLPAYKIAGFHGVELFLAAISALAVVLAYRLALRVVPDPWALAASLAAGLSPPFLVYATGLYPDLSAGAALAGAALLALRLDERPRLRIAFGCFAVLGTLPWLGVEFVPAGVVVGMVAARALWRIRRRTLAIGSVEVMLFSVTFFVAINESLYGGPTPPDTDSADAFPAMRWAPVFALALLGVWWLWRSRRDRLVRAVPELQRVELAAGLCAAVIVALAIVAVIAGSGRPVLAGLPLAVPLVALGFRQAPRIGVALVGLTLAASVWLYVEVRWGGGSFAVSEPGWGAAAAACAAAVVLLAASEARRALRRLRTAAG
jgi:hypothetical protein